MSEWEPIETAPVDEPVFCGVWENWSGRTEWKQRAGVVFTSRLFGLGKRKTLCGREYSHWKPLPPPPSDNPNHRG